MRGKFTDLALELDSAEGSELLGFSFPALKAGADVRGSRYFHAIPLDHSQSKSCGTPQQSRAFGGMECELPPQSSSFMPFKTRIKGIGRGVFEMQDAATVGFGAAVGGVEQKGRHEQDISRFADTGMG